MNAGNKAAMGLVWLVFGLWLLQKPNCNRGCQTIAEHIINHGLADLFVAAG
jgi:hypothetical protein